MFPLQSVLVPGAPLSLHIFEPRYRALMDAVMTSDAREFGVVLIERGSEVGGGDVRSNIGTVARIVEAQQFADGRWALVAVGSRRIDVASWLRDDPFPRASVIERSEAPWTPAASALVRDVEPAVRRALAMGAELGDRAVPATVDLDVDPHARGWQLIAVAPLTTLDRHVLLAIDDPIKRLSLLAELVGDATEVLAHRMRGL
jgi:hypothetical protein